MILALGTSWLLDGLQVTLAGSLAGILESKETLGLSDAQVSAGGTTYLAGAVLGAILFGYLTDRLGRRRKLFLVTLAVYSSATAATALSWTFFSFAAFRWVTGMGIGGEYAAISSAVDELIPGKVRETVDLIVNATFWIGAAFGSVASLVLLNTGLVGPNAGWRIAFGIGAALALLVLYLRLSVPESPRWLMLRGKEKHANRIVCDSVGRKPMITTTLGIPGLLLAATVVPFVSNLMSVTTLDIAFTIIFFIASSAASASYLTVSEIFPLEVRAFAIAIFYAIGTLIGGVGSPLLFGELIATGSKWNVGLGYLLGAALMIAAAFTEWRIGVEAAGKSLEAISQPIQSQ